MQIKELEDKINQARKDYYNGESKISDQIFDTYIDQLAELDPKNIAITSIGSDPISEWEKYTHKIPLGSLNKVNTEEQFKNWMESYIDKNDEMLCTLKLDGLSVSIIYENGILVNASTRGNSIIGEKITTNVIKMQNVPLKLPQKINATVRGEILLSKENYQKHFQNSSNCRNVASGTCRRFDGKDVDKLNVLVYEIRLDDDLDTKFEQFELLNNFGFKTPPYKKVKSLDEIIKFRQEYIDSLRDKYEYDLDGIVIHNNSVAQINKFGETNNKYKASIAFKFDNLYKEAIISKIEIQIGSMGRVTPVATFNPPVSLMGAEISRASLHNFSNIRDLGIGVGATVLICRSNDVIPFIKEVVTPPKEVFQMPSKCSECSSELIIEGEYLQCPNTFKCPAQVKGRISNYIKEIGILEWGDALINRLVESNKIFDIADLYELDIDELSSLDRMGKKSATKCYSILHANKEFNLDIFIGSLSIPLIGASSIKLCIDSGIDSLEKLQKASLSSFENIIGFGPKRAKSLFDGLKNNKDLIDRLLKHIKINKKIMGKLTGKKIVITGALPSGMKRTELEKLIIENGGEIKGTVGKTIDYLIIADPDSTSSKAEAAKKLEIKLLSENDFMEIIK